MLLLLLLCVATSSVGVISIVESFPLTKTAMREFHKLLWRSFTYMCTQGRNFRFQFEKAEQQTTAAVAAGQQWIRRLSSWPRSVRYDACKRGEPALRCPRLRGRRLLSSFLHSHVSKYLCSGRADYFCSSNIPVYRLLLLIACRCGHHQAQQSNDTLLALYPGTLVGTIQHP